MFLELFELKFNIRKMKMKDLMTKKNKYLKKCTKSQSLSKLILVR